jgi:glutathione synthase/RimK-type ligase-like ATP-grasp enzyme
LVYNKVKELQLVAQQIESLGGQGQVFCLSENTLAEIKNFSPTGLLWRSDSWIGHAELVLKLAELGLPQIPSFESIFIAGDKSFLNTLKEKNDTDLIPATYILSKNDLEQNLSFLAKDQAVLKPGDFGNGGKGRWSCWKS